MTPPTDAGPGDADLLRFAELIEKHLGLQFDGPALKELRVILHERMRATRCARFDAYLQHVEAAGSMRAEVRELARKLTIGETYFFRSPEQFTAFSEVAIPALMRTGRARHLQILSAGCSTGEEPYTLAITLRELGAAAPAEASILGVDLNPESIAKARLGRYSAWAMRATPADCVQRYFRYDRNQFVLDEAVRTMVRFEERNLAIEDHAFWPPGRFDVIFCRNMIMYLSARVLIAVVERFVRALKPDGFLFLGHAEPLRGVSQAFHVRHSKGAFYYVLRREEDPAPAPHEPAAGSILAALAIGARSANPSSGPAALAPEAAEAPLAQGSCAGPRAGLGLGVALKEAERFDEALLALEALAPADRGDPDVLLLKASILLELGQVELAAQVCGALLAIDDLNASAHYVTALCHEQHGRRAAAVESYRVAVYSDRAFAMPHLRLGLLFRRAVDVRSARRELATAAVLFAHEDAARILLFGGGFSRSALIDLCAAELRLCEEPN